MPTDVILPTALPFPTSSIPRLPLIDVLSAYIVSPEPLSVSTGLVSLSPIVLISIFSLVCVKVASLENVSCILALD